MDNTTQNKTGRQAYMDFINNNIPAKHKQVLIDLWQNNDLSVDKEAFIGNDSFLSNITKESDFYVHSGMSTKDIILKFINLE